jgi:16S rRNA G966 N2-methylase RsmD
MYNAMIDTTFCLCNKNFVNGTCIRVAGNFTAQHLPWYVDNDICNLYENYSYCLKSGEISTMSNVIMSHIKHNYFIILKNCETFLIENDKFLSFWKNRDLIENKVFDLIEEYLFKDKIIIDIGSMTGIAAMFGSRKSKHAYIIETDEESFTIMSKNLKNNCRNYTLINNYILNYDDIESIFKIYKIDFFDVSLIKINIGGGEENILNELLDINVKYGLKIYISIYYVADTMGQSYIDPPSVAGWTAYYQAPAYSKLWINSTFIKKRFDIVSALVFTGVPIGTNVLKMNLLGFLNSRYYLPRSSHPSQRHRHDQTPAIRNYRHGLYQILRQNLRRLLFHAYAKAELM